MFSSFITNVTMGANRAGNETRLVKTISMIKGSSKNVAHDRLVNGVLKGEIKGSSIDHINGLLLT